MFDVLATNAVLFMMLSVFPSTSIVSCRARDGLSDFMQHEYVEKLKKIDLVWKEKSEIKT